MWLALMGKSIESLSDQERIAYYRALAQEALERAHRATTDFHKAAHLEIAKVGPASQKK